jgi:hypothetical protein
MGKLPAEADAQMVRLYGQGWSAERIAQELGCSEKTVRNRLERAGVELRGHGPLSGDELARHGLTAREARALGVLEERYDVRLRERGGGGQ